jgi:protoheme IX farnesyltransferase
MGVTTETSSSLGLVATERPEVRAATWLQRANDYLALTRPRVLVLVLFTAPPAMALGRDGWPEPVLVLGALLGTALIGAACGALNAWYERDRDARMLRTHDRPLPAGRLDAGRALGFGLGVSALGLLVLSATGGWLPTIVGGATLAYYLAVYTMWLKPRSAYGIVAGGAAGAVAPLLADAAVSGAIGPWSLVLFAIVFVWQPPHFWAIALYRKDEYTAAGFPVLPVVCGDRSTRRRMLAWALALVPVSLLPAAGGVLGPAYACTAVLGGACFVGSILRSMAAETQDADRQVFRVSILYLASLFLVMLAELSLR